MVNPIDIEVREVSPHEKSLCSVCGKENLPRKKAKVVPPNPDHRSIFERTSYETRTVIDDDSDGIEAAARAMAYEEPEDWEYLGEE